MARLTKSDIERKLLTGLPITWNDGGKKPAQLLLSSPKARSLFQYLLASSVRDASGLPDTFIQGLADAYENGNDPAASPAAQAVVEDGVTCWRLHAIETEGFGGINVWKGPKFRFEFDGESLLIEGPNGSGKSSLTGALLWALTGERPRDQADAGSHDPKPVFDATDKRHIGEWPPIACYPATVADLASKPRVRVLLEFKDDKGNPATVERILENGTITAVIDPAFDVPPVFVETGLLMPARLAVMKLGGGSSRLTDAVEMLTGMDDLSALGTLVDGLCHKAREYQSYKKKDLAEARRDFEGHIAAARAALTEVNVAVANFAPAETSDDSSAMAAFGKLVTKKSKQLTAVMQSDLGTGLGLDTLAGQNRVVVAIASAEDEIGEGLTALTAWKRLDGLTQGLNPDVIAKMEAGMATARTSSAECLKLLEKSKSDSKFQMKAVAAQWHASHHSGAVRNCPLCDHGIGMNPALAAELETLRSAGSAAARQFEDNVNAIVAELNALIPETVKSITDDLAAWEPRKALLENLRETYVAKERYAKVLVKASSIVEASFEAAPATELKAMPGVDDPSLERVSKRLNELERAIALVRWFGAERKGWRDWWEDVKNGTPAAAAPSNGSQAVEGLVSHLSRLSSALAEVKPYSTAEAAFRKAWPVGKSIVVIEKEVERRSAIGALIEPLKGLNSLVQSISRDAIDGLSGRIATLLNLMHISEQLRFQDAQLHKKQGMIVYGGFGGEIRIDATLIANSSWLRAVLWAFIFALREEAVDLLSSDTFPLFVFDDPQATFDFEHRYKWANHVSSLQGGSSRVQVILATHDQMFLDLIKIGGITGREAMSAAAGIELGHMGVFEGSLLQRKWEETLKLNTPQAGRDYMAAVRVYLEGILKLMLRGEDPNVSTFVLGKSRDKIEQLHSKGLPPWDRPEFDQLTKLLGKHVQAIKHIEASHHASWSALGMPEATEVEKYWRKPLQPHLDVCIRLARDYFIVHGGLKALRSQASTVTLPEGHKAKVAQIPLRVLGKAAALTDGRTADGCIDMDVFAPASCKNIKLAQHSAYRLKAATMEPVARPGDMLIVKEAGEPSNKSLVIAISEDRVLARRFEISDNHGDIAVLTAQAINPRKIAPPIISQRASLTLFKVVGVLYEGAGWASPIVSDEEVCECSGEAVLSGVLSEALGLVEVMGQSAEPHALNGQYLIVDKQVTATDALKKLDGKPVIAADSDNNRYFKRLRIGKDRIVLESLDSGGDYAPVILSMPASDGNCLESVWPVAGVLFELPN